MQVRQEVLNVLVAQLLGRQGLVALPETVIKGLAPGRKMPDVLVDFGGLRLAIEGDFPAAAQHACDLARGRVEQGIAHLGVAVIYPLALRETESLAALEAKLAGTPISFAVITEVPDPPSFTSGTLGTLAEAFRRAYDQLMRDEVVDNAIAAMQSGIERFIASVGRKPATVERMAKILGMGAPQAEVPATRGADGDNR